ncbi:hypothetical protein SAMN02745229_02422 [Butyrivibrio fibrisolvens DSM 3071]|uniref:Uncharacterized protein n=1 Tax=Butyrivibrio fibrisolvens DSM 3071 TaxID=1121131 RepID=A0A1M5ZM97_BUTFI|nr:hypothetical protein [Butyrivibrio fibrisolvens]SHI25259.1 hypothetical protein SAMN02745229_02422 [Butyrivibrio fibrisolvens DSM 3071]
MQVSSVTMNNADLSTAIQSYQKALREDKVQQTQSQQQHLQTRQDTASKDADAVVAISQEGKEAYQKSQQVAKSNESNTSSDQSNSQNAAFKSFPEGSVRQLTPQQSENDPVRNEVASENAKSGQESVKNASKLENFELNPAINPMQETA